MSLPTECLCGSARFLQIPPEGYRQYRLTVLKNNLIIQSSLLALMVLLFSNHTLAQEKRVLDSILKKVKTEKAESLKIKSYIQIGVLYSRQNPLLAKTYLDSALNLALKHKNEEYVAITNINYGLFYYHTADYIKAQGKYYEALTFFEGKQDTVKIIAILNNIGLIHNAQNHDLEAAQYYRNALKLDKTEFLNTKSQRRFILNNLANIYRNKNQFDSARSCYKSSLQIAEAVNDLEMIGNTCTNLGDLFRELNQKDSILIYLTKGKQAFEKNNDHLGLLNSYRSLGQYYQFIGRSDEALKNYHISVDFSRQTHSLKKNYDIYLLIS